MAIQIHNQANQRKRQSVEDEPQYKSGRNDEIYRKLRNKVVSMIRADGYENQTRILQSFKGRPKNFYSYMRSLQTVKDTVVALKGDDG